MEEHGLQVINLLEEIKQNTDPELESDLTSDLYFTYVDDNWTKLKAVPYGNKYDETNKKLIIDNAQKQVDSKNKIPEDKKVFNLLTEIVNTIHPQLQMKNEVPSDHPELGLSVPFLDTSVWIEDADKTFPNGKIMHKYFEKKSKAQIVIHKDSDINERAKRTIHTQEVIRILRNTSRDLPDEVKDLGVQNYVKKLKYSDYDKNIFMKLSNRALKGMKSNA